MGRTNERDLDWSETDEGNVGFRRKHLSDAASGDDDPEIGCSLYELPPGKRSWPYHYHTGNAEAMYVLDGEGTLRTDGERSPLAPGDYVAFPRGERGGHRVINDGSATLRFLMLSTMHDPDVVLYPDSEKVGVYAGAPPGGREGRIVDGYFRLEDTVDYWEGEPTGE